MTKKFDKHWEQANPDWWYDAIEDEAIDEGVDNFSYYGNDNKRFAEFSIEPLNSGHAIQLTLLFDKDLQTRGDIDEGYLTVKEKKGCREPLKEKAIYRLGDIAINPLVMFAISILKVFEPRLAPKNEDIRSWTKRHEVLEKR